MITQKRFDSITALIQTPSAVSATQDAAVVSSLAPSPKIAEVEDGSFSVLSGPTAIDVAVPSLHEHCKSEPALSVVSLDIEWDVLTDCRGYICCSGTVAGMQLCYIEAVATVRALLFRVYQMKQLPA